MLHEDGAVGYWTFGLRSFVAVAGLQADINGSIHLLLPMAGLFSSHRTCGAPFNGALDPENMQKPPRTPLGSLTSSCPRKIVLLISATWRCLRQPAELDASSRPALGPAGAVRRPAKCI